MDFRRGARVVPSALGYRQRRVSRKPGSAWQGRFLELHWRGANHWMTMEPQPQQQTDSTPLSQLRHYDRIYDQLEAVWKAGNRPQLDDFLNQVLPAEQPLLLRQLLALDLDWRRRRGESPTLETCRAEYPAIDFGPVADLFATPPSVALVEPTTGSDADSPIAAATTWSCGGLRTERS